MRVFELFERYPETTAVRVKAAEAVAPVMIEIDGELHDLEVVSWRYNPDFTLILTPKGPAGSVGE